MPQRGVDALVQMVWPHRADGSAARVIDAPLANVVVDIAAIPPPPMPGDLGRSPPSQFWAPVDPTVPITVRLARAVNDGFLEPLSAEPMRMPMVSILSEDEGRVRRPHAWTRYVFNDVDVSPAMEPRNRIYFAAEVVGMPTRSTIWAHAADARTYFPERDIPERGCDE